MDDRSIKKTPGAVTPYAWVILLIVYLASVVAPINQAKVPPLMPILMDTFHLNLSQAGWLMSAFAISGLLIALPAGIVVSRFGMKAIGAVAMVCLMLGSALGAISGSLGTFLVSRVIEGIGLGLITVVAPASIAMWFPAGRQGIPMGIWATWISAGLLIIYSLAPRLESFVGWRTIWWMNTALAGIVLILYLLFIRMPPWQEGKPPQSEGNTSIKSALANRDIWLLAAGFACFNMITIPLGTFIPTFLFSERKYSLADASMVVNVATFTELFAAPLAGWLSDRLNSRRLVFSIPFIFLGVVMACLFNANGLLLIAIMLLLGFIGGAVPTASFAAAPALMGNPEFAGLGLATVMVGQNLGMFIGPALFGFLVDQAGWQAGAYWMIPACFIGFLIVRQVKIR